MDSKQARKLQGEIMSKAHQFKKDLNIDFATANKMAAKAVADAHGFPSAGDMQREIGKITFAMAKNKTAPARKRYSKEVAQVAERLEELATANDGLVPEDWKLAARWECTPTDLRRARDLMVGRGWTKVSRSGGFRLTPPDPVAPATNGATEPAVQGVLLEAEPCEVQVAILNELRQIRGLMAKMVGVWSK